MLIIEMYVFCTFCTEHLILIIDMNVFCTYSKWRYLCKRKQPVFITDSIVFTFNVTIYFLRPVKKIADRDVKVRMAS